jgi:5,6,7,8-tetrahydromethanopterin hydro-lyase
VYRNNREATRTALANGAKDLPAIGAVLAAKDTPSNPFYTPEEKA